MKCYNPGCNLCISIHPSGPRRITQECICLPDTEAGGLRGFFSRHSLPDSPHLWYKYEWPPRVISQLEWREVFAALRHFYWFSARFFSSRPAGVYSHITNRHPPNILMSLPVLWGKYARDECGKMFSILSYNEGGSDMGQVLTIFLMS